MFEDRENCNIIKIKTCPLELIIRRYLVISESRLSTVVGSEVRLLGNKT